MPDTIKFGDCSLTKDGLLTTPGGDRQLSRRLATLLKMLVGAGESGVSRDRLLDSVWGQESGSPQMLAKAIFRLRQASNGTRTVSIDSIYGHGYRLCIRQGVGPPDHHAKALAICTEAAHRVYDRRDIALKAALSMYAQACRLDPDCIRAYTGYALTLVSLVGNGQYSPRVGWPAARQALMEAIRRDAESADAIAVLAVGQCLFDWEIPAALSSLRTALTLAPEAYHPSEAAGRIALFMGKPKEAVTQFRRALEANPLAMNTNGVLAYALGCSGKGRAALDHIRKMHLLDSGNPMIQTYRAWVEAAYGDAAKACEVGAEAHNQLAHSATITAVYAFALASAGRAAEAHALLKSLEDNSKFVTRSGAVASQAWRVLGDAQAAVKALGTGKAERDYWLGAILQNPLNAELRAEPEFKAVYRTVFGSMPE